MNGFKVIESILETASAKGSRSTVLTILTTMACVLLSALLLSYLVETPAWVGELLAAFLIAIMVIFLLSYVYFMFKNPDALRSEKFTLQKMAIEKGFVGDDLQGVIDLQAEPALPTDVGESVKKIGADQ